MRVGFLIFGGLLLLWWVLVERRAKRRDVTGPETLVQDPECGVYVPKKETVRAVKNGVEYHFCSKACRDAFMKKKDPHA